MEQLVGGNFITCACTQWHGNAWPKPSWVMPPPYPGQDGIEATGVPPHHWHRTSRLFLTFSVVQISFQVALSAGPVVSTSLDCSTSFETSSRIAHFVSSEVVTPRSVLLQSSRMALIRSLTAKQVTPVLGRRPSRGLRTEGWARVPFAERAARMKQTIVRQATVQVNICEYCDHTRGILQLRMELHHMCGCSHSRKGGLMSRQ